MTLPSPISQDEINGTSTAGERMGSKPENKQCAIKTPLAFTPDSPILSIIGRHFSQAELFCRGTTEYLQSPSLLYKHWIS